MAIQFEGKRVLDVWVTSTLAPRVIRCQYCAPNALSVESIVEIARRAYTTLCEAPNRMEIILAYASGLITYSLVTIDTLADCSIGVISIFFLYNLSYIWQYIIVPCY